MAETIKGINVVIGSDTTGLSAALSDVNKSSRDIASELSKVERLLKFNPKDTQLLAQKQKLLGDQVAVTREKLDRLKTVQAQVNEQFKKGDITEGQYRAFQRELVETESKLKHFETQLKATQDQTKLFADRLGAISTSLDKAGKAMMPASAAAGALAGGLLAAAVNAGKTADDLNTLSKVTGLSTDTLQKFQYASDLIDVSTETLTGSLARLTRRMGDAQYGTARTVEAFERLGVNIYDNNGALRDSEDVFNDVINALGQISSEAERDAIAMELFGRKAQDLNPLILGGADALKKLGDEAEKAGLILSQEALDSINEFNDEIDILKATTNATFLQLGTTIGNAFLPVLKDLAKWLKDVMEWFRGLDENTVRIITTIAGLVAAIAPALLVMAKLTESVKTMIPVFKALTSSAGLWITAIGALIAAGIYLWKNWDQVKVAMLNIWDSIVYGIQQAISYLKTLLFSYIKMWIDAINTVGQYIPGLNKALDSAKTTVEGWIDAEKNAIQYRREERAEIKAQQEALKQAEADLKAHKDLVDSLAESENNLATAQRDQIQATQEQNEAVKEMVKTQQPALEQAGAAWLGFVQTAMDSSRGLKDAVKEMVISILSALQQQIVAAAAAAEALAYSMSLGTFGASLGHLAVIAAKVLPKIAVIEALKAGIRGLAEGAVVTGPTLALVGERKDRTPEAVLPLTQSVLADIGKGIAANMPQLAGVGGGNVDYHFHIGVMIGDERGYRQLARKVFSYEHSIKRRVGDE